MRYYFGQMSTYKFISDGVIKMDIKQKNLIFQFVERMYSENTEDELYKKEMELYQKLEYLEEKSPEIKNEICEIANLMVMLNGDIKYKFYEYGIMAKDVGDNTNLEWRVSWSLSRLRKRLKIIIFGLFILWEKFRIKVMLFLFAKEWNKKFKK